MLYAHDRTWDEYAILAEDVAYRDVDAAYLAACRGDGPVPPEDFAALLPPHTIAVERAAVAQPSRSLGIRR